MIGVHIKCAGRYSHCAVYVSDTEPSYPAESGLFDLGKTYRGQIVGL